MGAFSAPHSRHIHLVTVVSEQSLLPTRTQRNTKIWWNERVYINNESIRQTMQNTSTYLGTLDKVSFSKHNFQNDMQNWLHRFELAFGSLHYSRLFFCKHQDSKTNVSILPGTQSSFTGFGAIIGICCSVTSWKTMEKRRQYYFDGSEIPQENHLGFKLPW